MSELIYEDDEIQAFWFQGETPYVIISFGDMTYLANGRGFSIEIPVSKNGMSCLGVMAKRTNWYPRASLVRLRQAADPYLARYGERILYGPSMGGHAALKASALMGARTTIALCPQWSINPADGAGHDLGWKEYFHADLMGDMTLTSSDFSGNIFLFVDPYNPIDTFHEKRISELSTSVQTIPVMHCDHNVTPVLSGSRNFRTLISLCRKNNSNTLMRFVNWARRPHFFRKKALIERGLTLKPSLTVHVVCRGLKHDPLLQEIVSYIGPPFMTHVLEYGSNPQDYDYYIEYIISSATTVKEKFKLSLLNKSQALSFELYTIFGSKVFYDPLQDELIHLPRGGKPSNCVPVQCFLHEAQIELYVENAHCHFSLPRRPPSQIEQGEAYFSVIEQEGGRIALQRNGVFLSADPRGFISCDRERIDQWETFDIRCSHSSNNDLPDKKNKFMESHFETAGDITICAIAKDESRYIIEWIAYHLAVGATKILIFNNDSSDGMDSLIKSISQRDSRVELVDWPSRDGVSPQVSAYNHALTIVRTSWIGFIDIDEFIVPLKDNNLPSYLHSIPSDVSSIHINWRGYGSSGRDDDNYDFVTTAFTKASSRLWGNNHHFKSIARTALATEAFIHDIETYRGRRVLSDMREFETRNHGISDRVAHHNIQINHYQSKTFIEFEARMRRGDANFPKNHPGRSRDGTIERFKQIDQNVDEDTSIAKFYDVMQTEYELVKSYLGK